MTKEDFDHLIENCSELSRLIDSSSNDEFDHFMEKYPELDRIINSDYYEDSEQIDRFVEYLENNSSEFIDGIEDDYGYEKDAWDHFIEVMEESENWDSMFPEGDEDDSITDWMTKD